jgi:hypothetical protein
MQETSGTEAERGRAVGAEDPAIEVAESSEPTTAEPEKKKRGRPKKSNAEANAAYRAMQAEEESDGVLAVVDPRQLALLAGESTPGSVAVGVLVVQMQGLAQEWRFRASSLETRAVRLRATTQGVLDFGTVEEIGTLAAQAEYAAQAIRALERDLARTLRAMGVNL